MLNIGLAEICTTSLLAFILLPPRQWPRAFKFIAIILTRLRRYFQMAQFSICQIT